MKYLNFICALPLFILLTACQQQSIKEQATDKAEIPVTEVKAEALIQLFEVHKDNRIYVFYDYESYRDFVKLGHTPYVFTKIGAGPKGETLVFGLKEDDKKKREGIPSVELLEGNLMAGDNFYAEMNLEGRTYVFDKFEDMATVRKLGEAPLRHAKIGYGVNGESVIFVLNDGNKKIYPEALVSKFDQLNKS